MYYVKCILKEKKEEAKHIFSHTVYFNDKRIVTKLKPGRFVMVWLPGIDEFPISPSGYSLEPLTMKLTFKVRGPGTEALASLRPGDVFFLRGPYGNGFTVPNEVTLKTSNTVLIVGGGVGLAPLMPLIESLISSSLKIHVVCGFKNSGEAFFIKELSSLLGEDLTIATDDGSIGLKGTAVDAVKELLKLKHFSYAFACGPEAMLFKLHSMLLSNGIPHQMLIERYVKCALGVCGSCAVDGILLCKEGPVFNDVVLKSLKEFGQFKRLASGVREPVA
ncbi:MAG: dihydroorotate dehydrogenase electron transfer subunit [Candidatus Nezhaarchaeales archaeon]